MVLFSQFSYTFPACVAKHLLIKALNEACWIKIACIRDHFSYAGHTRTVLVSFSTKAGYAFCRPLSTTSESIRIVHVTLFRCRLLSSSRFCRQWRSSWASTTLIVVSVLRHQCCTFYVREPNVKTVGNETVPPSFHKIISYSESNIFLLSLQYEALKEIYKQ